MKTDRQSQPSSLHAFLVAFVASAGGFLFGYDLAIVSGANLYLKEVFNLSPAAFGFATGSAALGCIAGPFLGTLGLCSVASPLYISETAPARLRGALGILYQLAIVLGSVSAPFVSFLIVKWAPHETAWRWMFGSELLPVTIFGGLLLLTPQSPRWLADRGRMDEALEVLTRLEGPESARREMGQIRSALGTESGSFRDLFAPGIRYALLIGLLLAFFNNWTGWSVMGGYIPMLLETSGISDRSMVFLQYGVIYAFMGAVTLVACWSVDRWGRRPPWTTVRRTGRWP